MTPHRWWTWNSERPAELIHLASGLQITPVLYAASKERISLLNPGPEITFGRLHHGSCRNCPAVAVRIKGWRLHNPVAGVATW